MFLSLSLPRSLKSISMSLSEDKQNQSHMADNERQLSHCQRKEFQKQAWKARINPVVLDQSQNTAWTIFALHTYMLFMYL